MSAHWRNEFKQNFFASNLMPENGSDVVLTIKEVRPEELMNTDGQRKHSLVCYWAEQALPMVLNKTNCRVIAKLLRENDYTKWGGHRIQLYVDHAVKAFGETVDGLRVRAKLPEDAKVACEVCGQFIAPSFGMNVSQLAAYTKKKYGKAMCADCAKAQTAAERKTEKTGKTDQGGEKNET